MDDLKQEKNQDVKTKKLLSPTEATFSIYTVTNNHQHEKLLVWGSRGGVKLWWVSKEI